jgi:signal transduction histidine kinase/DNA-binding NarL/FixJ family response regulator
MLPNIHLQMKNVKGYSFAVFFAIFAVVMTGIMLSAIISFSSMVRISRGVAGEAVPHQQIFLLGSLVAEIQNAENSIRGYRLSHEPQWMEAFFSNSVNCSNTLSELKALSEDDQDKLQRIAVLSTLVQEKLEILESYSQLPDRHSVVTELQGISSRIEDEADTAESSSRSSGFIRNLFGRERQSSARLDSLQIRIMDEIEQVRHKQTLRLRRIDAVELDYLIKISTLDKEVEGLVAGLYLDALEMVETALIERDRQYVATNRRIRIFSVTAGLFLLLGGFSVFSYLRTRRHYERALADAKKNAELYSGMQERFIANMSHEVRTPLHAIAGFTEQLVSSDDHKKEEYLGLTNSAMKHLLQVVDDILDYSKLMAGKMKLRMEPFSPLQEAETVAGIFRKELESKGLKISLENSLPGDTVLVGDALRYRQVLMNLISNSVKFSHKGAIRIRIARPPASNNSPVFFTEVSDEGIGIDKENITKVFMPFEQAESTSSGMYRGTGLGLAITREIIEQQGGSITIDSSPGEGTKVIFTLPYLEAESLPENTTKKDVPDGNFLRGLRVLIADDERWNSRLIESMIGKFGADMTLAQDGNQAFLELTQHSYDLVLLDLRMPGKSGLEVARLARKDGKNKSTPIVSLTAQVLHDADKPECVKLFNAFLVKPFTEEQLLFALHAVLVGKGLLVNPKASNLAQMDQQKPPRDKQTNDPAVGLYDLDALLRLGNNDKAFAREMAGIFLKSAPKSLDQIRNAVEKDDRETILWHIHKLKPVVRQLRAGEMLSGIKELEQATTEGKSTKALFALYEKLERVSGTILRKIKKDFSF